MSESKANHKLPRAFFWRRMHSLTGIFLTLFLIEHLLVNSQAALFFGDDGSGFIHAVNSIRNLPYLPVIEIFLLGVPILIHAIWGIVYLRTGELNSFPTNGSTPSLQEYPRNQAYSWQRITSWILLFALTAHIIHMRFLEYPATSKVDGQKYYMVRVYRDSGLDSLSHRLNVQLYDSPNVYTEEKLKARPLASGQVMAVTQSFGTAELLMVRETFKMPLMIALYTIFVLSACFHGFNGLWTFMITWGVTLTAHSQRVMRRISTILMVLVTFLGLASIWATYWINLKQ